MIQAQPRGLIGSGGSADVFRLDGGRVLKLYRDGLDPGVIAREHDGVRYAQQQGLHVARAVGTQEHGGRRGIIFEELTGPPLPRQALFRPLRARALLRRFAEYHARVHGCSGDGLPHAQHDILHVRIEHADVDRRVRRLALDRLHAIPRGNHLCHGDFHPGNAILTRDGIAAIDWSSGSRGDPAGDVARTELLLRHARHGGLLRRYPVLRRFRDMTADLYLRSYKECSGMSEAAIDSWRVPVAVASLVPGSLVNRDAVRSALARRGIEP